MSDNQRTGQKDLDDNIKGINKAEIFYRPAKTEAVSVEPDDKEIESPADLDKVEDLLNYIKHELRYPLPLSESNMNELARDRVVNLLNTDDYATRDVRDLLSLFCDSLTGKQLMQDKFAMLVHFGDEFLLAHVRAERGLSIKQEDDEDRIELIRRFLDVDNLLSAAYFETDASDVTFTHFTDTGSDSFRNFLGVSRRKHNYNRKNVQIISYYKGDTQREFKFEFTNDQLDDEWLSGNSISLRNNNVIIHDGSSKRKEDDSHSVKEIKWGNDTYENIENFKSDFKEQRLGYDSERRKYQKLLENPGGSDMSVFDDELDQARDLRHKIELRYHDGSIETQDKGNFTNGEYVIYANSSINISSSFADDVFADIRKNSDVNIYHPSQPVAAPEFEVNNISFANIGQDEISSESASLISNIHDHIVNTTGESIGRCLTSVMLEIVSSQVEPPFANGIRQIINVNNGMERGNNVVSTKENENRGLIEYKNRQHIEGDDPAGQIVNEIEKEVEQKNEVKVFFWGVTEQTRSIDGLPTQSWNDDRVSGIQQQVNQRLDENGMQYQFDMIPIELSDDGDRWVISGMYY